jgi:carboxylesterase type B
MHSLLKKSLNSSLFALILRHLLLVFDIRTALSASTLVYNTTSGLYEARLVRVHGEGFDTARYLHKLISVPYAEQPERFKRARVREYRAGHVHPPQQPVICYQSVNITSYGLFSLIEQANMSEDCLVVNLYIPVASAPGDEKLLANMSVVVHVHGGSNMVGGAALFDGSILAAHGRVVVAIINYRLSVLGFMSDMTEKYAGNYGLRDQILAIKWIRQNCGVFGCNPNAITLWGHSAGAGDVNWLSISPLTRGLFQRAIVQSGSSFAYWGYDKQPFDRYKSIKVCIRDVK